MKADGILNRSCWLELLRDFKELATGDIADMDRCYDSEGNFWGGILLFGQGDLEVIVVAWGYVRDDNPSECCFNCLGNRTDKPVTDLSRNSEWRPTEDQDNDAFCIRNASTHPLMASEFQSRYFVRLGIMHLIDHKGYVGVIQGSILNRILRRTTNASLGAKNQARLDSINLLYKRWASDNSIECRLPPVKLAHIRRGGWSFVHGPLVKAANSRQSVPFFIMLCRLSFGHSLEDRMAMKILESLEAVYNIFDSSQIFLKASAKIAHTRHVVAMGECHMWLRDDARSRHELSWQVLPKVHQTQHLPKQADLINPRFTMSYCEGGCAGILAMIWAAAWTAGITVQCR